jgi:hypothetical protein
MRRSPWRIAFEAGVDASQARGRVAAPDDHEAERLPEDDPANLAVSIPDRVRHANEAPRG